ncbi:Ig-like domain-containing protein [Acholeplasma sp. OttesenSCG-928-E16]|nr:Ig-like domain-containing protein [Acholeplasma sp. OttesenSCG-928-E16]
MKKIIVSLSLLLLGIVSFACNNVNTELSITNNLINLKVGETVKIEYTTNSSKTPVFSIEDDEIASVDEQGNIKALAIGNTKISVKIDNVEKLGIIKVISDELYEAKDNAKEEINNLVASLNEDDYSITNWLVIIARQSAALKDIDSADSIIDINSIKDRAISDINAVNKKE